MSIIDGGSLCHKDLLHKTDTFSEVVCAPLGTNLFEADTRYFVISCRYSGTFLRGHPMTAAKESLTHHSQQWSQSHTTIA